jgi:hypothetical protein
MAEFNYFGSLTDTITLLDDILNTGFVRVFADIAYRLPMPWEVHDTSEQTIFRLMKNQHVFISPVKQGRPRIKFSKYIDGFTSINQLKSQLIIDMSLNNDYIWNGKNVYKMGCILRQSRYFVPNINGDYLPTQYDLTAFELIKKIIIQNSIKRYWVWDMSGKNMQKRIQTIYIGKNAMIAVNEKNHYLLWGEDTLISNRDLFEAKSHIII